MQNRFSKVFENNMWGGLESRSGPGSSLEQTGIIRARIPSLLSRLQVKTLLDIPCGDFYWMKEIREELDPVLWAYIGADIVAEVIQQNRDRYQTSKFQFQVLDLTKDDLPKCDLVMVRDCFLHLSFGSIADAICNVQRSGAEFMLASTYPRHKPNQDTEDMSLLGRAVNLCAPPFSLPNPLELIEEGCTEQNGEYDDKSLGLWRLQDLHAAQLRVRVGTQMAVAKSRHFVGSLARTPRRLASAIYRRSR